MNDEPHLSMQKQLNPIYPIILAEHWDRFSFYGIQSMLVLYCIYILHFNDAKAYGLYGVFTALTFAASVPGGYLADRFIGVRRAMLCGVILMAIANILLVFQQPQIFYFGLSMLALSIGIFKPNNASLVGLLYHSDGQQRTQSFSLLYMAMNAGALLGPLCYGFLITHIGWHSGFIFSAVGILITLLWLLVINWQSYFATDNLQKTNSSDRQEDKLPSYWFYFILICTVFCFAWLMQHAHWLSRLLGVAGVATGIGLFILSYQCTALERRHLLGLCILIFFCIFFFACSLQTATSLTIFIERYVYRTFGSWQVPTMMFLSLQPLFIILAAPLLTVIWAKLHRFNSEPGLIYKIVIGLLFAALSFALFACAAAYCKPNSHLATCLIIGGNFLLSIGELCVLPTILMSVTQLAPLHIRSTVMGVFFLAVAFSGYFASVIAKFFAINQSTQTAMQALPIYSKMFIEIGGMVFGIAVILWCFSSLLNRLLEA